MPHHLWREGSPPLALGHSRKQRIQGRKRRKREDDIRRERKKGKRGGERTKRKGDFAHIDFRNRGAQKRAFNPQKVFFWGGKGERRVEEYASGLLRSFTFLLSAQHQTLFFTPYSKEEEKGG